VNLSRVYRIIHFSLPGFPPCCFAFFVNVIFRSYFCLHPPIVGPLFTAAPPFVVVRLCFGFLHLPARFERYRARVALYVCFFLRGPSRAYSAPFFSPPHKLKILNAFPLNLQIGSQLRGLDISPFPSPLGKNVGSINPLLNPE